MKFSNLNMTCEKTNKAFIKALLTGPSGPWGQSLTPVSLA